MSFLTLAQAKLHCRIDGTDGDADLTIKISAAERAATEYLQCNVYANDAALTAAINQVPGKLESAKSDYDDAMTDALAITDGDLFLMECVNALNVYNKAKYEATRTRNGIVINDLIINSMLLLVEASIDIDQRDKCEEAAFRNMHPFRCYA